MGEAAKDLFCYRLVQIEGGKYHILPIQDDPSNLHVPADSLGFVLFQISHRTKRVQIIVDYTNKVTASESNHSLQTELEHALRAIKDKAARMFRGYTLSPRPAVYY